MSQEDKKEIQITPTKALNNKISDMRQEFVKSLPAHIKPDKFVKAAQNAVVKTPALASNVSRSSFYSACMTSAELGLMPNGKEAAIVPYKGEAQYIPMYEGLLKLVRNSGMVSTIVTEIVYENDTFEYYVDDEGPHIIHKPIVFGDRGKIIGVYCLTKTKDDAIYIEIMNNSDIKKVENASRAKNGPWKTWREEMIKKSVFRRIFKRLPKSTDIEESLNRALEEDEEFDVNSEAFTGKADSKNKEEKPQQSRLKTIIKNKSEAVDVKEEQPEAEEEHVEEPTEEINEEDSVEKEERDVTSEDNQNLPI